MARPMKIVVLGGTGFVGQALVHALQAAGHNVDVLSRNREQHRELGVYEHVRTLSTNVELAEAEIKLGLAFEAEGGIILVKSKGSANLEVTLKLKPVRPAP